MNTESLSTQFRYALALALCALVTSVSVDAHAQANEPSGEQVAARRIMLQEAQRAQGAGDHQHALDVARRAGAIQMTPSLRMFIATEESAVGHVASGLGDAEMCTREAERDLQLPNRGAILQGCRALEAQLRPRIAQVVVHAPDPAPAGLRITLGGEVLDANLYGLPAPVTAGHVVVEADAQGYEHFHAEIDAAAGASSEIAINLQRSQSAASTSSGESSGHGTSAGGTSTTASTGGTSGSSTHGSGASSTGSTEPRDTGSSGGGGTIRIAGVVIAALGVVSLGVGLGLYADTSAAFSNCEQNGCLPSNEPRGLDLGSVVMIWGGTGLAVVGAALFLVAPILSPRRSHATAVWIDPHGGLGITGRF